MRLPKVIMIRRGVFLAVFVALVGNLTGLIALAQPDRSRTDGELHIGVAEVDITPPIGFPMAGYYHQRLAEREIDRLTAKAIVFEAGQSKASLVVCDLIGIATYLAPEVRHRASNNTGIPLPNIVISATHAHTAPDFLQ